MFSLQLLYLLLCTCWHVERHKEQLKIWLNTCSFLFPLQHCFPSVLSSRRRPQYLNLDNYTIGRVLGLKRGLWLIFSLVELDQLQQFLIVFHTNQHKPMSSLGLMLEQYSDQQEPKTARSYQMKQLKGIDLLLRACKMRI